MKISCGRHPAPTGCKGWRRTSRLGNYKNLTAQSRRCALRTSTVYIPTADILQKHPELYAGDGIHAQAMAIR